MDGVIAINSYDELKKALGYYDYIVNPDTKEGKFMFVDGSAVEGNTILLMADLSGEGDKENPKAADGTDKADVVTGATVVVTKCHHRRKQKNHQGQRASHLHVCG